MQAAGDSEDSENKKIEFFVGQIFESEFALKKFRMEFELAHGMTISKTSSRTGEKSRVKRVGKNVLHYEMDLRCSRSGKYKSRAQPGIAKPRKRTSQKTDCPFKVTLRAVNGQNALEVRSVTMQHNHSVLGEPSQSPPEDEIGNRQSPRENEIGNGQPLREDENDDIQPPTEDANLEKNDTITTTPTQPIDEEVLLDMTVTDISDNSYQKILCGEGVKDVSMNTLSKGFSNIIDAEVIFEDHIKQREETPETGPIESPPSMNAVPREPGDVTGICPSVTAVERKRKRSSSTEANDIDTHRVHHQIQAETDDSLDSSTALLKRPRKSSSIPDNSAQETMGNKSHRGNIPLGMPEMEQLTDHAINLSRKMQPESNDPRHSFSTLTTQSQIEESSTENRNSGLVAQEGEMLNELARIGKIEKMTKPKGAPKGRRTSVIGLPIVKKGTRFDSKSNEMKKKIMVGWLMGSYNIERNFEASKIRMNEVDFSTLSDSFIDTPPDDLELLRNLMLDDTWERFAHYVDQKRLTDDFKCAVCRQKTHPTCKKVLMCDDCLKWQHLVCVGIKQTPAGDWFCRVCSK